MSLLAGARFVSGASVFDSAGAMAMTDPILAVVYHVPAYTKYQIVICAKFRRQLWFQTYPKTPAGLAMCNTPAVPFFGWTLAGDVVYSAALFGLYARLSRTSAVRFPSQPLPEAFLPGDGLPRQKWLSSYSLVARALVLVRPPIS
jgi:hypothetical protein